MRSLVILFLIAAFVADVSPAKIRLADCPKTCPLEYIPICGVRFGGKASSVCTFINMCALQLYACLTDQEWHIESNEPCQWPTEDCEEIMTFFRLNKKRFTHDR